MTPVKKGDTRGFLSVNISVIYPLNRIWKADRDVSLLLFCQLSLCSTLLVQCVSSLWTWTTTCVSILGVLWCAETVHDLKRIKPDCNSHWFMQKMDLFAKTVCFSENDSTISLDSHMHSSEGFLMPGNLIFQCLILKPLWYGTFFSPHGWGQLLETKSLADS